MLHECIRVYTNTNVYMTSNGIPKSTKSLAQIELELHTYFKNEYVKSELK